MIREAMEADISRIVEMGSRSLIKGPYRELLADRPEVTAKLAENLLFRPDAKILVAVENGQIEAVFAFFIFDHYFSGEKVAGEIIWYCEPEFRKLGIALPLLWEAENLASSMGAKKMQLTAPTDEIAGMYGKLKGYAKVETAFQRDISLRSISKPRLEYQCL